MTLIWAHSGGPYMLLGSSVRLGHGANKHFFTDSLYKSDELVWCLSKSSVKLIRTWASFSKYTEAERSFQPAPHIIVREPQTDESASFALLPLMWIWKHLATQQSHNEENGFMEMWTVFAPVQRKSLVFPVDQAQLCPNSTVCLPKLKSPRGRLLVKNEKFMNCRGLSGSSCPGEVLVRAGFIRGFDGFSGCTWQTVTVSCFDWWSNNEGIISSCYFI